MEAFFFLLAERSCKVKMSLFYDLFFAIRYPEKNRIHGSTQPLKSPAWGHAMYINMHVAKNIVSHIV